MSNDLEAPGSDGSPNWAELYRARGHEVVEQRPVFTGDVFHRITTDDGSESDVLVLQHPCALRTDGVSLSERVLVAQVVPNEVIQPSRWNGHFRKMPLPDLVTNASPNHFAALFQQPLLVRSVDLHVESRIACLSQLGVNLLMQRWVHHNSRVIVPTHEYMKVTSAAYEETDLIEDWCSDRADDGVPFEAAMAEVDGWLSDATLGVVAPRELLKDAQYRSEVRKALRRHRRHLLGL